MSSESKRRIWVIPLIAIAALTAYAVSTIEIGRDSTRIRRVGSLEDIEALTSDEETNLLFIVVDTLRAERMSAYGYSRATTPFIDKLAQTRGMVGGFAQRVDFAADQEEERTTVDKQVRSQLEDLDFAEAATRYSLLQTQLNAGMRIGASLSQQSLLDFLG